MIRKIPVSRPYHGLIRYDAIFRFWDRAFDLISDALPFGRLWYGEPNAIRIPIGTDSSATARPRLRGLPWRGVHIFSTATLKPPLRHHRVLAAATKELQLRILDLVNAKNIVQRLNDVQDKASHRCDSRLR
jgi:hypothetical protein